MRRGDLRGKLSMLHPQRMGGRGRWLVGQSVGVGSWTQYGRS